MNRTSERRSLRPMRRPRRPLTGLLAIVAGIALLTSGCSGGSPAAGGSAGSPAGGSGGSTASAGPGGTSFAGRRVTPRQQLAYSECMRSHGVPGVPTSMPGPVPGSAPSTGNFRPVTASGPNPGSPQWDAAQHACRSLMPTPAEVPG